MFESGSRKVKAKFVEYAEGDKRPIIDYDFPFYKDVENLLIERGTSIIEQVVSES
jgi:hypothetical protein